MDRFVSNPIDLPAAVKAGEFTRVDLIFYGVDARRDSFRALVFLDEPGSAPEVSPERTDGLAGTFTIFGHGGCVGHDPSHCDPEEELVQPFDSRPPHPLQPQTKFVEVTKALRGYDHDTVVVTVIPIVPSAEGPRLFKHLTITEARLTVYRG